MGEAEAQQYIFGLQVERRELCQRIAELEAARDRLLRENKLYVEARTAVCQRDIAAQRGDVGGMSRAGARYRAAEKAIRAALAGEPEVKEGGDE